jgi:FtsH-binding integral membrane protein
MKASSVSFMGAVVLALVGMGWGIVMAASQDHSTMPAHAHLNLLGWVSLFLFGLFYHLHPAIDASRIAVTQVAIWIIGTVVLTIGVALVYSGNAIGDPIAAVSSLLVVAAMALFGWIVLRRDRMATLARPVPAE